MEKINGYKYCYEKVQEDTDEVYLPEGSIVIGEHSNYVPTRYGWFGKPKAFEEVRVIHYLAPSPTRTHLEHKEK